MCRHMGRGCVRATGLGTRGYSWRAGAWPLAASLRDRGPFSCCSRIGIRIECLPSAVGNPTRDCAGRDDGHAYRLPSHGDTEGSSEPVEWGVAQLRLRDATAVASFRIQAEGLLALSEVRRPRVAAAATIAGGHDSRRSARAPNVSRARDSGGKVSLGRFVGLWLQELVATACPPSLVFADGGNRYLLDLLGWRVQAAAATGCRPGEWTGHGTNSAGSSHGPFNAFTHGLNQVVRTKTVIDQ